MRVPTRIEFAIATAFVVVACGGGSSSPRGTGGTTDSGSPGSEGRHCYPNGTCNSGLSCFSKLCVKAPPATTGPAMPPDGGMVSAGGTLGTGGKSTGGLGVGLAAGSGGATSNGGCAAGIGGALVVGNGGDCSATGVCVAQVLPTGLNAEGCRVGCATSIGSGEFQRFASFVCTNTGGTSGCPVGSACAVMGVRSATGVCLVGGGTTNDVCTPGGICVTDQGDPTIPDDATTVCTPSTGGAGGTDAGRVADAGRG